jgi:Ca2+-binding RTX toxin-like protein
VHSLCHEVALSAAGSYGHSDDVKFQLAIIAVLTVTAWVVSPAATALGSGTLSLSATELTWAGTTADDSLAVSALSRPQPFPNPPVQTVTFRSATTITVDPSADAACGASSPTVVCNRAAAGGNANTIRASGSDGVDSLSFEDNPLTADSLSLPVNFDGGAGEDQLSGSAAADTELRGGLGTDTINGEGGGDAIDGDDTSTATTDSRDVIDGGPGDDNIEGQGGNDSIVGGDGNDVNLSGDAGNDTIQGGDGEDAISGDDGDDTVIAGPENDVIDGGPGNADLIRYDEPTRGGSVTVDLSNGTTGKDGGPGETTEDAVGFERVTGTALGDDIRGNDVANLLDGRAGDDRLAGAGGSDIIDGGPGSDTVSYAERGASGPVIVSLDGAANDGATAENDDVGADVENALGGAGADTLTGNDGANVLDGGAGGDRLAGLGAIDEFRAGEGDDTIAARDGNAESIDCGTGQDHAEADAGDRPVACEVVDAPAPAATPAPPAEATPAPAPAPVDADRDGVPAGTDCDDANGARHQGATEIRGNAVDEDCDGRALAFELISATVARAFNTRGTRTTITRLTVKRIPAGTDVVLTCRAPRRVRRGCPIRRYTRTLAKPASALPLAGQFKGRKLLVGVVVEVRVTGAQTVGRVLTWTMRDGKLPRERDRCVLPGATRTSRCPAPSG